MRKALLVAATLFTSAAAVTMGEAAKANDYRVLNSQTGVIDFYMPGGTGTATFNNAIGVNNSFQVGSNTSLGVNASAQSTPEFGVKSRAKFDLSGSTTIRQINGTSGAMNSQTSQQIAALTYAHDSASSTADTLAMDSATTSASTTATTVATEAGNSSQQSWESTNSSNWVDYVAGGNNGTYTSESEWDTAHTNSYQDTYDTTYAAVYDDAFASTYASEYEAIYASEYASTYTNAISAVTTDSDVSATNGTISGSFVHTESGAAASSADMTAWEQDAQELAMTNTSANYGNSFTDYQTSNGAIETDVDSATYGEWFALDTDYNPTISDEETWQDAYSTAYSAQYRDAFSEIANSAERKSDSSVTVTGLGVDAMVVSAPTSSFDVQIDDLITTNPNSTATADGQAVAIMSSTSVATQSQAQTATAFMQSFSSINY